MSEKVFYACFDAFPTSKGASTHIQNTCIALSEVSKQVDLFCLSGGEHSCLPENVKVHPFYFDDSTGNYLRKATLFSEKIFACMETVAAEGVAQFRDIWSGLGMINRPKLKTIFEVNALTSIELPEKYPLLTPKLLEEIRRLEALCLQSCQHIVTPSNITKNYLIEEFSIPENKITVIPNGGDVAEGLPQFNISLPKNYILYFGALQPWQGLDVLIKSLHYLRDYEDLSLVICSSVKEKANKNFIKLAENIGVSERLVFYNELDKATLHHIVRGAKASVSPLKFGLRNITQGCCPIKVLETMACKTPLISSEVPVVKELVGDYAYYFWPEDEMDLSRCIRFVLDNQNLAKEKAEYAYERYQNNFTWQHHNEELKKVYRNLLS
ncbi:glycosyltransferase family 4 protein [Riemerella anatipestifer]|nr:glycosyltransferase family 4 protein [Riemerella anatipestifer]MDY3326045.1 glycosyltransferase family 4 protein [Riemerella anatipestifer]MDY3354395.1 glycosyltransferase family 4 protein [Riemerella anatipestifer]